jgi:O-antigen ligase
MLNIKKDRLDGRFYLTEEGFKAQVTNHLTTQTKAESALFEGMESIGSSRVYIWSRTIPMLKERLLLGSGPDHYAIVFPQYDIVGKANWMSSSTILVDKPHNLYLDLWVNTGFISLLAYLAILLMYIVDSFKLYFKSEFNTFSEKLGASILPAIIGYHVSAIFNDNIVSVAPAFFAVLAVGITVNYMIKTPERFEKSKEIITEEEMIEPNN